MLPGPVHALVSEALGEFGDTTAIRSARSLGGGCINNAMHLETIRSNIFLNGTRILCQVCLPTRRGAGPAGQHPRHPRPAVLAVSEAVAGRPAYILLEWLEGRQRGDQARLGEQLANLHRAGVSPQRRQHMG